MIDIAKVYEENEGEYLKFDRIESPISQRPDLHAFMLLDKIMPSDRDMIASAEHDEIWLSINCEELAQVITEAQFIDLIRCGVRYDDSIESLALFV